MRLLSTLIFVTLTACGGGGGGNNPPSTVTAVTAPDPVPVVEMLLSATAPNDSLAAAVGTPATALSSTTCGMEVGTQRLTGVVTSVHDGDTVTVAGKNIRLDSLDAPELTQTYGKQSQANLASLVLNQQVLVAYTKSDKYGRIVGAVFTPDCVYVNLKQVSTGSAWYYRAYQCEISATARSQFEAAEDAAKAGDLGLWAGTSATPPWVYRNGVDAKVPVCSGPTPLWEGNPAPYVAPIVPVTPTTPTVSAPVVSPPVTTYPAAAPVYTPAAAPTTTSSGCYTVYVKGYRKSNGTYVSGYTRRSPGCA